jgi:glyoxylase-like metal-dependent hydrolase (beta-lactamase superfamily II)
MLVRITDNIWIFPRDEDPNRVQPNVGVIITGDHTVLVDGGNSPRHGRRVAMALHEISAPPVTYIIYTHSHWDHVFGAQAFNAPAIAHELCLKQLQEAAAKPWSHSYLQEEIQRTPAREAGLRALGRAIEDWRGFRVVLPEITLAARLRLYLGPLSIEVEHVGGAHAPDSVVVRVPEARVMFTGDCYYPPPHHLRKPEDTLDWEMMERLLGSEIDTYIDGHGPPQSRAALADIAHGVKG